MNDDTALVNLLDGELLAAGDFTISARDPGLVRGDGVFEVVRLYAGRPYALEPHLERMARSAASLELPYDAEAMQRDCRTACEAIAPRDAYLRILLTRSGARVMFEEPLGAYPEWTRLMLVPYGVVPWMAGVKSLSYAANCEAKRLAEAKGCDDALLIDARGEILEGPFCAFAWVRDQQLYTPPLSAGILDSITRRTLFEVTDIQEARCTREDLEAAEEACVIGTGREIRPVSEILDVRTFDRHAPVVAAAQRAYLRHVHATLASVAA